MIPVRETKEASRSEVVGLIKNSKQFYRVTFVKRSDGSVREMICRNGVHKHLKGGNLRYSPRVHNLINTYSMIDKDYRAIAIEGILEAKIGGILYKVVGG